MIQSPTCSRRSGSVRRSSRADNRGAVAAVNFRAACRHSRLRSSPRPLLNALLDTFLQAPRMAFRDPLGYQVLQTSFVPPPISNPGNDSNSVPRMLRGTGPATRSPSRCRRRRLMKLAGTGVRSRNRAHRLFSQPHMVQSLLRGFAARASDLRVSGTADVDGQTTLASLVSEGNAALHALLNLKRHGGSTSFDMAATIPRSRPDRAAPGRAPVRVHGRDHAVKDEGPRQTASALRPPCPAQPPDITAAMSRCRPLRIPLQEQPAC